MTLVERLTDWIASTPRNSCEGFDLILESLTEINEKAQRIEALEKELKELNEACNSIEW